MSASELNTTSFPKLQLKEFARTQERETSESRYWKAFSVIREHVFQSSPNCIHFNPQDAKSYIVTASVKVSLFDGHSDKIQRAYSRFTDDAFSGRFRHDGKLITAGEKSGVVKVFEEHSKSLLRQLKRHSAATRAVSWTADGLSVLSASDDKHIYKWDLATGEHTWSASKEHSDYIRGLSAHPQSVDMFATSSYDHSVKVWDSRGRGSVLTLPHPVPVETCLFTSAGSVLITAAGSEVKLWDIVSGGKLLHTFNNHQKNVSGLCLDGGGRRLLSCGLDGHVKVYGLDSLQVIHGMKFPSPLLSVGVSPDDKKLVLGFVNGLLSVRNHKKDLPLESSEPNLEALGNPFYDMSVFTLRPRVLKSNLEEREQVVVETDRPAKLAPYEGHLKKFNYQRALDAALSTQNPVIVVTVLEELCRRGGLTIALSGRDEGALEPLLSFLARYVSHPRYSPLVVQISHRVLDLYASCLGLSYVVDELFGKLAQNVQTELRFERETKRVLGSVEGVMNLSALPKRRRAEKRRGVGAGEGGEGSSIH